MRYIIIITLLIIFSVGLPLDAQEAAVPLPLKALPPSTLLAPNTTEFVLLITSEAPASCRYALTDAAFDQMTPFDSGSGATQHQTRVWGLDPDPNTVNTVYVRCDAYPDVVLPLHYRSLSQVNPAFPRTGNLWGSANFIGKSPDEIAKIDLWLGAHWSPNEIIALRQANPDVRVLTSYNAVEREATEAVPDSYWLYDVNGNRVEVWPGAYRLNMTRPEVAEFQAQMAYQLILDSGLMFDGIFIDNVFTTQSWQDEDIFGNDFAVDANQDGQPDDPDVFDAAWRAGLLHQLRRVRELLPNAILSGHAQEINDPEMAAIFNATSIGFDLPYVIEGRIPFADLWERYEAWQTNARPPAGTMVESAVPLQIGYGYGFLPWDTMPTRTVDFARDYYPYMRFGLAFTLMHDGYFAHEIGDTWHGNDWWYDELDYDLGYPLGPAQFINVTGRELNNRIVNGNFESPLGLDWELWADASEGYVASLTGDTLDFAEGVVSARIDVTSAPGVMDRAELRQQSRELQRAVTYDVTFWAKSNPPREMAVAAMRGSPPWTNYGLYQVISIDGEWREYRLTFTANANTNNSRLQFMLGAQPGTVWLDDVRLTERPPDVLRREFDNGIVLLNASRAPQAVVLGPGYRRLQGAQAALYEYIVDDLPPGFSTRGDSEMVEIDSGEWQAAGPYYHDWGPHAHLLRNGEARWDLQIPAPD
ncbi:MAG: carbohydrate binding domain-containing protein, partial [Anaerolineae bacterium]|nr:carbohydrate binding domain-containing protein [Anaerolineae bacterium]